MAYPGYPPGAPYPPSASASPSASGSASTPAATTSSAQQIQDEARRIVRGWPVASAMQGLGDVIQHLPPVAPVHPSFLPAVPSAPSSHTSGLIPAEPLFDNYAREMAAFAGGRSDDPRTDRWRQEQLARVLGSREVRDEVKRVMMGLQAGGNYGGLPPLQPPYPFSTSAPPPPTTDGSLASQFLRASSFPAPPPPTSFTHPAVPPFLAPRDPAAPSPLVKIDQFVDEQVARAQDAANAAAASAGMKRSASSGSARGLGSAPQTPSTGANGGRTMPPPPSSASPAPSQPHFALQPRASQQNVIPTSSPDPLSLPYVSGGPARPKISATLGGVRYSPNHPLGRKRSSASLASSPTRARSGNDFEIVLPPIPRRFSSDKGKGKGRAEPKEEDDDDGFALVGGSGSGATTPHAHASQQQQHAGGSGLDAPFSLEGGVKRFKLDSRAPATVTPGTGASGGGKASVVEKLDDLLSDVFSADDAFVLDTSSAAVGGPAGNVHRSPSRRGQAAQETRFFRTTAVAPSSSLPLLHTDTLKKLLALFRTVAAKGKAEELVEAVEEGGVGRLLKLLERSWDGVEGWKGWERDAGAVREEVEVEGPIKGKGKGRGKKGASPAKGGKKGKGRKKAPQEDDEDDEELDELASSPAKGTRRSSRTPSPARSRTPAYNDDLPPSSQPDTPSDTYWTSSRLAETDRALRNLDDALLALRLALEVLTLPLPPACPLPKHLFSADYLSTLVAAIRKGALEGCFLPLLTAPPSSALAELASSRTATAASDIPAHTPERVPSVCDSLQQAIDALARLVVREELGDDLVISLSYLSLEPFFHDAPASATGAKGKAQEGAVVAAAKGLRMASLGLVQAVYGRYSEQRAWVVEEVLGNLGKGEAAAGSGKASRGRGAIRLRTGASIQTISALLLHLVQTPPSNLALAVRQKLAQAEAKRVDENGDSQMEPVDELEMGIGGRLSQREGEEEEGGDVLSSISRRLLDSAAETAQKAARTIIGFLLQRSAKAVKTASGTADAEYRAVLDHLINDLLATLHLPEWPGAEVLLGVCCRSMMATLADPKSSHEVNALKGIALEYLGTIAARIRQDTTGVGVGDVPSLREAVSNGDVDALEKVYAAHRSVLEHLARPVKSSGSSETAGAFTRLSYARDLLAALEQSKSILAEYSANEVAASQDGQAAKAVYERLEGLVREIWEEVEGEDVFGPTPEDAQPRIDALSAGLWRSSSLAAMYDPLLQRIVDAAESSQVTLRTKALRAVSLVVAQDPELFHQSNIRRSIENRMLDASPAVRDASIELVGKYVVGRPDLAVQYLPKLGERISDTGLSVRRRVVKLLKVLYYVVDDEAQRIDICRRLVYRVLDEDDGIKDLAVEAVEDLWFGAPPKTAAATQQASNSVAQLAQVVMKTTGVFKDRPPPVDEALRMIMAKHAEKGTPAPLDRVKEVMETLIDSLVEDDRDMDVVASVKTVFVLSAVDPSLLSTAKATLLLPFLKSATTVEEQMISDYLLRIFRAAVLAMPKSSTKFGRDLQASLVPMLNKPSQSVATLQEVVACFCAVVHSQTQDYATMLRVFGVTFKRLAAEGQKLLSPETAKSVNIRQLPVLCYMAALLCENGDFDRVREERPATKASIDSITTGSVAEHVYQLLVNIHNLALPPAVKSGILTSLGFLYRAHPTLMLHASSTTIIDAIFDSPNPQMHVQVLRIMQDFLASQERVAAQASTVPAKKKKAEQGVRMDELVGNVDGFADSGVASAIAQRYLPRIIDSSLSANIALQRLGVDLLSTIARSGFSHPITLSPTLVALTASADAQIAAKAFSTLSLIHQKHASLLATRFLEPARAAHSYVKQVARDEPARGFRGDPPESLLGRWYSLLHKEKRQVQLDFLKTLSRSFEVEVGGKCSEDAVSFARFIAEALSTFDYKRNEEPLLVISVLNSALAVTGLQVLHHLEEGLEGGGGLLAAATGSPSKQASADPAAASAPSADLARQSIVSGLALLLRDHLKHLYSITDAKLAKYVVGKKSPMGDKAVTRRTEAPLALGLDSYERMPFALVSMSTEDDLVAQRETYRRLIAEDGTIGALEELEHDEGDA
ncbi:hypothetical protein JCM10207_002022 [Rhodosporidiobolus poonsookiae]